MGRLLRNMAAVKNSGPTDVGFRSADYASGVGIAVRPVSGEVGRKCSTPNATRPVIINIEKKAS